jgi:hypothetical protein
LDSSLGIAIPTLGSPPLASGGSREGGRGIGEENVNLGTQSSGPFHRHSGKGFEGESGGTRGSSDLRRLCEEDIGRLGAEEAVCALALKVRSVANHFHGLLHA